MTESELKERLTIVKNGYLQNQEKLRMAYLNERQSILNAQANETARFKIGDILQCHDMIIRVDSFKGSFDEGYGSSFYVTYRGHVLTKQLKPRKDGLETSFFDDGREITKIEK